MEIKTISVNLQNRTVLPLFIYTICTNGVQIHVQLNYTLANLSDMKTII